MITPRQVNKLVIEKGFPRIGHGSYNLEDVIKWLIDRQEKELADLRSRGGKLTEMEHRRMKAETELVELKLAERRLQLISVADAERIITAPLNITRIKLQAIPKRLSIELSRLAPAKEVAAAARAVIDDILLELAGIPGSLSNAQEDPPEVPLESGPAGVGHPKTPRKNKRKRVGRPVPGARKEQPGAGPVENPPG